MRLASFAAAAARSWALALALPWWLSACSGPDDAVTSLAPEGGDAARGRVLLAHYQCGACHEIPEVPSASGRAGPALAGFGQRSYIAGQVPNRPSALVRWIQDPQAVLPQARMPDMGVNDADARDMAAYLLSLR